MTEFLDIPGGRIAYGIAGAGQLVLPAHGLGDLRQAYRFLAPRLAGAGYRAAAMDIRGHGESRTGWHSYSPADRAGDILTLIGHLGGPANAIHRIRAVYLRGTALAGGRP